MPVTMTRRAALIAAAVAPLAACSAAAGDGSSTPPTPADPDLALRVQATDAERTLISRYQATVASHPDLQLDAYIARHQRHLDELLATAPFADTTAAPQVEIAVGDVPASRADAVAALREAESANAAERTDNSLDSIDFDLARVLASVAACESAHVQLLGDLA